METKRLIIDRIRESDKEDYFLNISHDRKVLETFICRYAETVEDFDIEPYLTNETLFAIRLKETGKLIGIILYFDEKDSTCEIGYDIGSDYWNNGYVTEAVQRFLNYLFDEKGFETVCASFFTGNDASRRVMEKCGMTYSRFSEKELSYLGVERDLTYYSISREEYRKQAYAKKQDEPEIILLNGPSSAGKSSIAAKMQNILTNQGKDAVIISLDDYLKMSVEEPIWEDDVYETVPAMSADIAKELKSGKTVIIDHVITSSRIYDSLLSATAGHAMKTVLIQCDPEILKKREAARGNRFAGSAQASSQYLYPASGYDLAVDTSENTPQQTAGIIIRTFFTG